MVNLSLLVATPRRYLTMSEDTFVVATARKWVLLASRARYTSVQDSIPYHHQEEILSLSLSEIQI